MAEIDWDKIIKAARSKREEEDKAEHLERRLHRMEKILDKLSEEKSREKSPTPSSQAIKDEYHPQVQRPVDAKHGSFAPSSGRGLGFPKISLPKFGHQDAQHQSTPVHPTARPDAKQALPQIDKKAVAAVAAIAAVVIFTGLFLTNSLPSFMITPLTGFFWANSSNKSGLKYVCEDGVTTVENLSLCPTTIPTSSTQPTTTSSSVATTTSVRTTTTSIGPAHWIDLKSASCSKVSISAVIMNGGTSIDTTQYLTFVVDGTVNNNFVCTPLSMGPGESVTCVGGGSSILPGQHSLEVRGLKNSQDATVNC